MFAQFMFLSEHNKWIHLILIFSFQSFSSIWSIKSHELTQEIQHTEQNVVHLHVPHWRCVALVISTSSRQTKVAEELSIKLGAQCLKLFCFRFTTLTTLLWFFTAAYFGILVLPALHVQHIDHRDWREHSSKEYLGSFSIRKTSDLDFKSVHFFRNNHIYFFVLEQMRH